MELWRLVRGATTKGVNQLDMNGVIIKYWASVSEAAKELKLATSNISKAIKGRYSHTGGFKWEYA